ncbi:sensor histidine kinase [Humibacter ginsenosidimutans]|uniref:histidine kinase n=1 Tax=Humibacter ginsenosidimutans TaxID=2599293 RepID=A0A5B8M499_9MICO|nr:sensor histidine kinase [Humibacter ginsenosidimutans]QDZ15136.1 sensor histidine kinase [Humibacter ginsenosidimutans]
MWHAVVRLRRRRLAGFPVPDVALAALLCIVAVASVLTGNPDEGPVALTLPVAVATTAALLWRRREPLVCVAIIVMAGFVQTVASQPPGSLWSLAVYAIAMYSLAAYRSEGVAAVAGAVFVAALLVQERIDNGVDYVFILLLFGGLWLLGRLSRYWRTRVSTAEQRQHEAARLAVAEERVRIARELHDIVAHSLSVIAVQSDAAEAALVSAPDRAAAPVQAIRSTARGALGEIRRMLDVLRTDDDELPGVDSPGIGAIEGLVEATRASGCSVELDVRLTDALVPPEVDLAGYRIIQECLTNVRKHAHGADAVVTITQERSRLVLRVTNTAGENGSAVGGKQTAGGGYGVRGMRERVESLGGTLHAGPTADGGFEADAVLPLPAGRRSRRPS